MNFWKKSTPTIFSLLRTLRTRTPNPTSATTTTTTFKRSYYVDRDEVVHFRRRGPRRWSANPRTVLVVAVVGSVGFVTVYYGNLETVPYTKRTHVILLSSAVERQLGESQFKNLKEDLKGKILPPIHPDSVRIRLISKQIVESLQRGLQGGGDGKVWSDMEYGSVGSDGGGEGKVVGWGLGDEGMGNGGEVRWGSEDEILDDKWVQQSREKAKGELRSTTQHLEGLNWEVVVVKDSTVNAMCMPGGKIIVFTGLLEHFRTDSEIATVLGHEVGHAVARHVAEGITKNLWLVLLQLVLLQFFAMPDLVNAMSNILFRFPFSRRMEMEADYIGLLLMASAGYDPRIAPNVYQDLGQITGDTELQNYLSTHPSSKKRAQLLSQAHVMEEAFNIYREVCAGHGVEGFL